MGKKKHTEEHVNLERWLVSYADFITLLFATFVVLYALAQVDVSEFTKLEDSIKKAFASPSLIQGSESMMTSQGASILDSSSSLQDQAIVPPILEYTSQKYEQESFETIKKSLDKMKKSGELQGVDVTILDRGLVINLNDMSLFFKSGSAELSPKSYETLKKIGELIRSRFASHLIRTEGHTDNLPMASSLYPSNWELSAARSSSIVRFLLQNFKFKKDRFAALGYADTRPLTTNTTEIGRQKNRRVEIVVLRNKYTKSEAEFQGVTNAKMAERATKEYEQQPKSNQRDFYVSDAAKQLAKDAGYSSNQVVILKDSYDNKTAEIQRSLEKFEKTRSNRTQAIQKNLKSPSSSDDTQKNVNYTKYPTYSHVNQEQNIVKSLINNLNSATKLLSEPKK